MNSEFTSIILQFTGEAGVALTEKQAQLLGRHIQIMLEWNPRLNLTRITESQEIIVKHILDSILPAKYLPRSGHALDVGTGAGFPGIPLKILYPDLEMVLLDSSRKKISFLTAVVVTLGLKGIRALHGRWQDFSTVKEHADSLKLITMRALKLEPEHITCLAPLVLAPGGVLAWWAVPESEHATEDADSDTGRSKYSGLDFQGDFEYSLSGIKQRRALRLWKKTGKIH